MYHSTWLQSTLAVLWIAFCPCCGRNQSQNPSILHHSLPTDSEKHSVIILPDSQYYAAKHPEIFTAQTTWIKEHQDELNIRFAIHLGDIVNDDVDKQWENAQKAMAKLDDSIPYALASGNHDFSLTKDMRRTTLLNKYFSFDRFASSIAYGGEFKAGSLENTFHYITSGAKNWVVLSVEYAPSDEVLAWANTVISEHPNHLFIVATHAYLDNDGAFYEDFGDLALGENNAEGIWKKMIKKHPNIMMAVSGHVTGRGASYRPSTGEHGNVIHQMLSNYQMRAKGGEGYLRIMEFQEDGKSVQIKTYSPYLDRYMEEPHQEFSFELAVPKGVNL